MFDFSSFREHPRPLSSYTDATNLLESSQGAVQLKRRSCNEVQPYSPRAMSDRTSGCGLLETSRFPVIKSPFSTRLPDGVLDRRKSASPRRRADETFFLFEA